MEKWARKYPGAQFLCVCVDMVGVARQFGQMFDFRAVVSCHIPSREYFPKGYGQLGCSGFIVADREGNFVSRKTKAYLQFGEMAFGHVEELLRSQGVAADGGTEHGKVEEEKKESGDIEPVPSVGVDSMDEEHKRCEAALALLQRTKSVQALETLLEALLAHFDHEEKLMALHDFGNASNKGDAFSPFKSHCKDHERILEIGFRALGKAQDYKSPSSDVEASNCTTDS